MLLSQDRAPRLLPSGLTLSRSPTPTPISAPVLPDEVAGTSSAVLPPSYESICYFMRKYTAKLAANPLCGVAPYEYSGKEYAMVLGACVPYSVNLSQLSWSSSPLASQLRANLQLFCDWALRLGFEDAPLTSLQPDLLQPSPSCLWDHMKVQHWLYRLAQRHPPRSDYDACGIRWWYCQQQLGEPFVQEHVDGPVPLCPCLVERPPFNLQTIAAVGDYQKALKTVLRVTPSASPCSILPEKEEKEENDNAPSRVDSVPDKSKPWLSYSKPWNLPAINAAKAKKAKEEAHTKTRLDTTKRAGTQYQNNALCNSRMSTLGEQLAHSSHQAKLLRRALVEVKRRVAQTVMDGIAPDFGLLAVELEGIVSSIGKNEKQTTL